MNYNFTKLKQLSEDLSIDITFSSITNEVCIFTENDNEYRVKTEEEFDKVINALGVLKDKHVDGGVVRDLKIYKGTASEETIKELGSKPKEFPKIQIPVYGKGLSEEEIENLFKKLLDYGYGLSNFDSLSDQVHYASINYFGYIVVESGNNITFGFKRTSNVETIQPEDLDSFLASLNKD